MKRNKSKVRGISYKPIMCLTVIVSLNLFGISYASFNDDFNINTTVSTGDMKPHFMNNDSNSFNLVGNDRGEFLDVSITSNKVTINGVVSDKFNENLFVNIIDKGSIPFCLKDVEIIENDNIIQSIGISENNRLHLHLKAQQEENESQHHFRYELIFEQCNE